LVLPLGGHDLGIGARDVDVGVHASLVVRLNDVTAEDLAGADTTVVWTLRGGESVLGPSIRPALRVEECVFLLETEPELVRLMCLHEDSSVVAEVVCVGLAIGAPGLAHDEDVVTANAERVRVEGDGVEVHIRVVAGGLAGGGTVEVPFGELLEIGDLLSERLEEEAGRLAVFFGLGPVMRF
jgi:hypothetical protein